MPPELPPPFIVGETYSDGLGDYRVISLESLFYGTLGLTPVRVLQD
jgi:hypothetical protein